jgi:ferric-dicitrate binding protein FerR (iron transport regulator)
LFINDHVGTGVNSRLTLHLGKDTTLRLGEQARLTLDRLLVNAGGEITLQSGPILFSRPAGSTPARMQIKSSFGLIAVRGTRFFAGPSAGVFGVFVERGSVAVSGAGTRVVLEPGRVPISPVRAPRRRRLRPGNLSPPPPRREAVRQ